MDSILIYKKSNLLGSFNSKLQTYAITPNYIITPHENIFIIWDLKTNRQVYNNGDRLNYDNRQIGAIITKISYFSAYDYLIVGYSNGTILIYNEEGRNFLTELSFDKHSIKDFKIVPELNSLFVVTNNSNFQIVDLFDFSLSNTYSIPQKNISCFEVVTDPNDTNLENRLVFIFVGFENGSILIWSLKKQAMIDICVNHCRNEVLFLMLTQDKKHLIVGCKFHHLEIFSLSNSFNLNFETILVNKSLNSRNEHCFYSKRLISVKKNNEACKDNILLFSNYYIQLLEYQSEEIAIKRTNTYLKSKIDNLNIKKRQLKKKQSDFEQLFANEDVTKFISKPANETGNVELISKYEMFLDLLKDLKNFEQLDTSNDEQNELYKLLIRFRFEIFSQEINDMRKTVSAVVLESTEKLNVYLRVSSGSFKLASLDIKALNQLNENKKFCSLFNDFVEIGENLCLSRKVKQITHLNSDYSLHFLSDTKITRFSNIQYYYFESLKLQLPKEHKFTKMKLLDTDLLIVATSTGMLVIYHSASNRIISSLTLKNNNFISFIELDQHENKLYVITKEPNELYEIKLSLSANQEIILKESKSLSLHNNVLCASFSKDFSLLALAYEDNNINILSLTDFSILNILYGHANLITSVLFSANNDYLVTGSTDRTIRMWELKFGNIVRKIGLSNEEYVLGFTYSKSPNCVLAYTNAGFLWYLSLTSKTLVHCSFICNKLQLLLSINDENSLISFSKESGITMFTCSNQEVDESTLELPKTLKQDKETEISSTHAVSAYQFADIIIQNFDLIEKLKIDTAKIDENLLVQLKKEILNILKSQSNTQLKPILLNLPMKYVIELISLLTSILEFVVNDIKNFNKQIFAGENQMITYFNALIFLTQMFKLQIPYDLSIKLKHFITPILQKYRDILLQNKYCLQLA